MDHFRHPPPTTTPFATAPSGSRPSHAPLPSLPPPPPPPPPHQQQQPPPAPYAPHNPAYAPYPAGGRVTPQPSPQPLTDFERERSFSASSSGPKRLKMNGGHSRNPSTDGPQYYGSPHTGRPPLGQSSSHPPPPLHAGLPPSQHYENARSPEMDRLGGPGSGYRSGPAPPMSLQQAQQQAQQQPQQTPARHG
ncbi:hypothetical protein FN846DRAFT_887732 [Sphaerosporella brunnea]|uniref:Uncharacterized protein n=1 Tax=Sphaerosporella brunnea TaxID=1250544 RepID=A0A5J5F4R0_9PEZI|nr:hypothetical protein FN846DRAFT_887732 [Sphaerosporella brunnea]